MTPPRAKGAVAAACLLAMVACSGNSGQAPPPSGRAASTAAPPLTPPAAADSQSSESSAQATIQRIDARSADVRNRRQSFRQVERDLSGFSAEGGMLHAFFDRDTLTLVEVTFYGETGQNQRAFYYQDAGRPFFVLETESRYDTPLGKVADTRESRYYFQDGRLIGLVDGGRQVSPDAAEYAPRVTTLLKLSDELAQVARRP